GAKLVRGAYMEKERQRAEEMGYPSPIQDSKEASDRDFDAAVALCMNAVDQVSFMAGTHNENSCRKLVELMKEKQIAPGDKRIYFGQLLGMSDNISFNLAYKGYRVAKYVPYGPVKAVLPYLFRRAQENTAISGQMGRELKLIREELQRRKGLRSPGRS
ncbi:MAG TPA: proline dehydrogenase family protein, partial [Anseongella sp.]|nr:proline dehydrogenase family protein [Anseongella sp.]